MEEFGRLEERVVLVGVQTGENDNVEESLDELEELAGTAGAVTVGKIIQNREAVHPGTYIGKGKIEKSGHWFMPWMRQESSVMMNFLLHSLTTWNGSWTARLWTGRC